MIEPCEVDLIIYQGATFDKEFIWETRADRSSAYEPVDLTGCTPRMQIRKKKTDSTVLVDLTENDYIFIADAPNGIIGIEIPESVTKGLDFSSAEYDIEIVHPSGKVNKIIYGHIELSYEVTRN